MDYLSEINILLIGDSCKNVWRIQFLFLMNTYLDALHTSGISAKHTVKALD